MSNTTEPVRDVAKAILKSQWGSLEGVWVPHDIRDKIDEPFTPCKGETKQWQFSTNATWLYASGNGPSP